MRFPVCSIVAALLAASSLACAQSAASPYVELRERPIRALSPQQISDLREARGMGLSLAAELNSVPGPLHVLELRESLSVSDTQAAEIERVMTAMREAARTVGEQIIAAEGELDAAFRSGRATEATIDALTQHIAQLNGRLRAAHLKAHLQTQALLTVQQIAAYDRARGYDKPRSGSVPPSHGNQGPHRH